MKLNHCGPITLIGDTDTPKFNKDFGSAGIVRAGPYYRLTECGINRGFVRKKPVVVGFVFSPITHINIQFYTCGIKVRNAENADTASSRDTGDGIVDSFAAIQE